MQTYSLFHSLLSPPPTQYPKSLSHSSSHFNPKSPLLPPFLGIQSKRVVTHCSISSSQCNLKSPLLPPFLRIQSKRVITHCSISSNQELTDGVDISQDSISVEENKFKGEKGKKGLENQSLCEQVDIAQDSNGVEISQDSIFVEKNEVKGEKGKKGLENQSLWEQVKEIVMFTAPATGLWICGPLMSLIDTAVIGQGSSLELAALGPGTVLCDNMSYVFMFLSISTSNLVATSLAKQDKNEVQHQLSVLLFIALTCGFSMILFTKFLGVSMLTGFAGSKNLHLVPVANKYVQIRGLAWPAILVGWVAQSASLGMKDSWGPLKALTVASAVNGIGDIVLCRILDYGIAGAAWATMVSQVIAAYMMVDSLNKKGYNALSISIPSPSDLMNIFQLAAPVFVMMMSKVAFYSLLVYCATSMGTLSLAAHQVMIQAFMTCTVWGEPLSQTAQSFMPELMYGSNRNLERARMLLKSLVIIGSILGLFLGIVGTSVPWLFPNIFTPDQKIIQEMHRVLIPFFMALAVTPCILSFEGTLLAGRDLKFLSLSMSGCFSVGALTLLLVSSRGYGLVGCWCTLLGFQWARFFLTMQRLLSPNGILFSESKTQSELQKLKAA